MKRTKPTGRTFVIHDAHAGPLLAPVQRVRVSVPERLKPSHALPADRVVPAALPRHYGYSNRKAGAPKGRAVYEHAQVFGIRTRV